MEAVRVSLGRSDLFGVKMESSSSSKIARQGSTKTQLKATQVSQPQKDQDKPSSQGAQVAQRKLNPEWLEKFSKRTFFDRCSEHPIRQNDLNKYCIDCDAPLCQYCLSLAPHLGHRLLKIYRHVYKDVVPFAQIVQHIDCTKIQPYKCNKQMVIALSPLPHNGSGQTSKEATCLTCKRKLIEYDIYKYCSIACKVVAFKRKKSDSAPPFLLLDQNEENTEESSSEKTLKGKGTPCLLLDRKEQNTEAESSSKKTLKRKSAPFLSLDREEQNTEAESSSKKTLKIEGTPFMFPDRKERKTEAEASSKRTRKRKGTPHRAPFY